MSITPAVALPIGVNTMSFMWRDSARAAMETLAREGYRRFELMAQPPHLDPSMGEAQLRELRRLLDDSGLAVETINLPSLDQNRAGATPQMRECSVQLFERLIVVAAGLG